MTLAAVKRSSSTLTWTGAALLMTLVVSVPELRAQDASSWPAQSDQFRFHMIGNAHIDPVWLWPWSEGCLLYTSRCV